MAEDDLRAQIEELKERVKALEAERGTVQAPFRVVNEQGQTAFLVEVVEGRPRLVLFDEDGARVVRMGQTEEGYRNLVITRGDEMPGVALMITPDNEAAVGILNQTGQLVVKVAEVNGAGVVVIYRADGSPAGSLLAMPDGSSHFVLMDEQDEIAWFASTAKEGSGE
jgi:hypothetical protein